jgi:hypothetical protein
LVVATRTDVSPAPTTSYEVPDDDGFLGLLDPDAYAGFVGRDWTLPRLIARLQTQMRERRLLLWGTGREGMWRVRVVLGTAAPRGFREVTGPIVSTGGRLLLTHWGTLTMAASYEDVPLPEPHEQGLLLTVPPGEYRCTVVQLDDPDGNRPDENDVQPNADFVLVLDDDDGSGTPWVEFPWAD